MKSRLIALLVISSLLVVGYVGYAYRYPLAAKIWHWKHGYSASMGSYVVPVLEHWLILDENAVAFTLMNASPKRPQQDGKFHTAAVINFFPRANHIVAPGAMELWLSLQKQRLANEQIDSVELKTLKFEDDSITCIGGAELNALAKNSKTPQADAISLDCMSAHGLEVLFVGEPSDVQPFYTFLSQIRPKTKVVGQAPVSAPIVNLLYR